MSNGHQAFFVRDGSRDTKLEAYAVTLLTQEKEIVKLSLAKVLVLEEADMSMVDNAE